MKKNSLTYQENIQKKYYKETANIYDQLHLN